MELKRLLWFSAPLYAAVKGPSRRIREMHVERGGSEGPGVIWAAGLPNMRLLVVVWKVQIS